MLEVPQPANAAVRCSGAGAVQGAAAALCLHKCPWPAALSAVLWETPASPSALPRACLALFHVGQAVQDIVVLVDRCDSLSIEAPSSLWYNVGSLYYSL